MVLTLNRPEARNALNQPLIEALGSALNRADDDDGVRAVILTGTGDRAFCAGADLKARALASSGTEGDQSPASDGRSPSNASPDAQGYYQFFEKSISKPVIAAVNGFAVGGGFELALACDLVVAADHAEFGLPEVSRGLIGANGAVGLARRLPRAIAFEIVLIGERIPARRAEELGLVNRVVPLEQLLEVSISIAARIADNAPLSVLAAKRLVHHAAFATREEIPELKAEARRQVMGSEDAREGARAFTEKRKPVWTNR
jgi:crotonobetainyl-CoA hydratase